MIKFLNIICVVFFVQGALSKNYNHGKCPEVYPMSETFHLDNFFGVWHVIAKYPVETTNEAPIVEGRKCVYINCASLATNLVAIDSYAIDTNTGEESNQFRNFKVVAPGQFYLQNNGKPTVDKLTVLDTDYKNFATLYACTPLEDDEYQIDAYIVGRNSTMNVGDMYNAIQPLMALGLDLGLLAHYNQTDCPPIPEYL